MRTVIEKEHTLPEKCHHLRVILDGCVIAQTIDRGRRTINPPRMLINASETTGIIAKIAIQYRRKVYLGLGLSFEQKKDSIFAINADRYYQRMNIGCTGIF